MTIIPDGLFMSFAVMCGSDTALAFAHLTCTEVDLLAKVLVAGGMRGSAMQVLLAHTSGLGGRDPMHGQLFGGWLPTEGWYNQKSQELALEYMEQELA